MLQETFMALCYIEPKLSFDNIHTDTTEIIYHTALGLGQIFIPVSICTKTVSTREMSELQTKTKWHVFMARSVYTHGYKNKKYFENSNKCK